VRKALLVLVALFAPACGGCATAVGGWVGDSVGRCAKSFERVLAVDGPARRLTRIRDRVAGAPAATADRVSRTVAAGERLAAQVVDDGATVGPKAAAALTRGVERGAARVERIARDPFLVNRRPGGFDGQVARIRANFESAPERLHLFDFQPADETDPERWCEIEPPEDSPNVIERALKRYRL
jgi:hypothetical protein